MTPVKGLIFAFCVVLTAVGTATNAAATVALVVSVGITVVGFVLMWRQMRLAHRPVVFPVVINPDGERVGTRIEVNYRKDGKWRERITFPGQADDYRDVADLPAPKVWPVLTNPRHFPEIYRAVHMAHSQGAIAQSEAQAKGKVFENYPKPVKTAPRAVTALRYADFKPSWFVIFLDKYVSENLANIWLAMGLARMPGVESRRVIFQVKVTYWIGDGESDLEYALLPQYMDKDCPNFAIDVINELVVERSLIG